jgi:hypothetical protein
MFNWFWSLLKVCGIEVRAGNLDMADINPFDVPWSLAKVRFTLFGRKIGGD